MAYVPKLITTPDTGDLKIALRSAFATIFKTPPTQNVLALLLAQSAFETGYWKKCYNFNLGNIRPGSSWTGDRTSFAASEVVGGVNRVLKEGDPNNTFRAYPNLEAGALDYVKQLAHVDEWKKGLLSGRPDMFVSGLVANKDRRYFTANPETYLASIKAIFPRFGGTDSALAPIPESALPKPANPPEKPGVDRMTVSMPKLKLGDNGPAVGAAQKLINQRAVWSILVVTGVFDAETEAAVKRLQSDAHITVDGIIGRDTWDVLIR